MITKIQGEAPFQVLTNNFSISPSQEGYTLQISADGINYSNLFSVGANVTRLVTGVAANSYYRLLGNQSDVSINWMKTCVTEGGGSGSGSTYTAGEYISIDQDVISVTGITPSLYATTADTQAIEEHLNDVEYVTATALTELHDAILEISGSTGGSNYIIPAITSQTDYEAISGDVKTGDLIEVYCADINDDGNIECGLFRAFVEEQEDQGVITRTIEWERKDNENSIIWADKDYPWMADNDVYPVDFGENAFIISLNDSAGDGSYNGIGFDDDGKPVITHIAPQYDEQTGEITGITREDTPIGPDEAKEEVIAAALVDLDEKKVESTDVHSIVKLTQAEYDLIASPDPTVLYIIVNQ